MGLEDNLYNGEDFQTVGTTTVDGGGTADSYTENLSNPGDAYNFSATTVMDAAFGPSSNLTGSGDSLSSNLADQAKNSEGLVKTLSGKDSQNNVSVGAKGGGGDDPTSLAKFFKENPALMSLVGGMAVGAAKGYEANLNRQSAKEMLALKQQEFANKVQNQSVPKMTLGTVKNATPFKQGPSPTFSAPKPTGLLGA